MTLLATGAALAVLGCIAVVTSRDATRRSEPKQFYAGVITIIAGAVFLAIFVVDAAVGYLT